MQLHVAGALEFLEDDVVHPAARLHQGGGNDGEAAAVFDVPGRAEEALGPEQRSWVQAAGQGPACGRNGQVVGPGQPGDGIQQHHHVLAHLHQPLGPRQHHLRHPGMVVGLLVEGGVDHLALDGALHVRDLLGSLVDQQHDQVYFGVLVGDGVGHLLQKRGLARLGLGHDHATLSLADGGQHVDQPQGQVALADRGLQPEPVVGIDRHQVLEPGALGGLLRALAVHLGDVHHGAVAIPLPLGAGLAHHVIAVAQVEAANLGDGDVHVIRSRQAVLGPQEAVAVGLELQHARAVAALARSQHLRHGGIGGLQLGIVVALGTLALLVFRLGVLRLRCRVLLGRAALEIPVLPCLGGHTVVLPAKAGIHGPCDATHVKLLRALGPGIALSCARRIPILIPSLSRLALAHRPEIHPRRHHRPAPNACVRSLVRFRRLRLRLRGFGLCQGFRVCLCDNGLRSNCSGPLCRGYRGLPGFRFGLAGLHFGSLYCFNGRATDLRFGSLRRFGISFLFLCPGCLRCFGGGLLRLVLRRGALAPAPAALWLRRLSAVFGCGSLSTLFRFEQHLNQCAFVGTRRNLYAHFLGQAAQFHDGLLVQGLIIHRLPPMG